MKLKDINPWWKTGKIEKDYEVLHKRDLINEIVPYIKEKQIIAINGLRRTGKTVIMYHIIDSLLKKYPKENIFYYNFDIFNDKIENILNSYMELLDVDIKKEKIFVFFDEIQKHKNWENELKILYDTYKNIKFFISGSSNLFIEKKTKESLGGRVFSFVLEPLTFKEYLRLRDIEINKKNFLSEEELKKSLKHYLKTGGFPELLDMTDNMKIKRYVKELIIDRVIYIDIPSVFKIEEPELLAKILSIISANPGMLLDYESLANDLSRNRKTISNYVFYLEKAFLIKKLYNYSKNLLTNEKKLKKIYPSSTTFAFLFDGDEGKIIENVVLMNDEFRFFSRVNKEEVDFIKVNKSVVPVEIKYRKNIKKKEVKNLVKFIKKNKLKEGIVVTEDKEGEEKFESIKIKYIPLWKWLLK